MTYAKKNQKDKEIMQVKAEASCNMNEALNNRYIRKRVRAGQKDII